MKRVWLVLAVVVMMSGVSVFAEEDKTKHEETKETAVVEKSDTDKTDVKKDAKPAKKDVAERLQFFINDACKLRGDNSKVAPQDPTALTKATK